MQRILVGRSSSHFTRITRIMAEELGLPYRFEVVRDLLSAEQSDYAGNPALKLPILRVGDDIWCGSLNICRELYRHSPRTLKMVWPEDLDRALTANAQEFITQAMSTEVNLIMNSLGGGDERQNERQNDRKMRQSLGYLLHWLEEHVDEILNALPQERALSFLEISLFCLVTHLEFRQVMPVDAFVRLNHFCANFSQRDSTLKTPYYFDAA